MYPYLPKFIAETVKIIISSMFEILSTFLFTDICHTANSTSELPAPFCL